jgi:hypothetical protein
VFVKQTRRNAPFIVASPCQSEIKRTLRRASRWQKTAHSLAFRAMHRFHSTQMVNAGFPAPTGYGFERVDAANARLFAGIRHQSKIYTESNQSNFRLIFGDLTSMQTLAIYRQLLIKH